MAIFPSQGGSKNTWGTELRSFFGNYFNLLTGYFKDPWIDARSYATLALANTAAAAAGKPLLIASEWTISTATTISVPCIVPKGGMFTKSGSGTFTLSSNSPDFSAGTYQVFSGFSSGDVTGFAYSRPIWFGANITKGVDATVAINSAIQSLTFNSVRAGRPVLECEPAAAYLVDDANGSSGDYAILIDKVIDVRGNGAYFWNNGDARTIKVTANDARLKDINTKSNSYTTSGATSALAGTGFSLYNATGCRLYNCTAMGFEYGFGFVGSGEGCGTHDLYSCEAVNNHKNVQFTADSPDNSYVTDIKWFGGSAKVLSAFSGGYVGSCGIRADWTPGGSVRSVDGIHFYGTLVEGNAEIKVYMNGRWSSFNHLYYDTQGPIATNDIVIGSDAQYITIVGGSALNLQNISDSGTATAILDGSLIKGTQITGTDLVDISAATAGQIKFPSTANESTDANTLDGYAEGTWSPTVDTLANFTGTPTISNGLYTRVGNQVHVEGILTGTVTADDTLTYARLTIPYSQKNFDSGATGIAISEIGTSAVMGYVSDYSDGTAGTIWVVFPASALLKSGSRAIHFSLNYTK